MNITTEARGVSTDRARAGKARSGRVVRFVFLALLPAACASETGALDPGAASTRARPRCVAPAPIPDEQRRTFSNHAHDVCVRERPATSLHHQQVG